MKSLNRYIYLACPYSDVEPSVREFRFNKANEVSAKLMEEKWIVYSPISHSHPIAQAHDLPQGWEFWGRMDRVFIHHCLFLAVLMLPGWNHSEGVRAEIKLAKEYQKPVLYLNPDGTWYYPRLR